MVLSLKDIAYRIRYSFLGVSLSMHGVLFVGQLVRGVKGRAHVNHASRRKLYLSWKDPADDCKVWPGW